MERDLNLERDRKNLAAIEAVLAGKLKPLDRHILLRMRGRYKALIRYREQHTRK